MNDTLTAREHIPAMLDAVRPDRYDPADKTWQATVVAQVADELTEAEARTIAAGRIVTSVESIATRRTNALLREIAETGQVPIDWLDAKAWPLAIDDNERVCLRAATVDDFQRFAERERRAAARDFTSRNQSCEGALALRDRMVATGAKVGGDVAPTGASE